MKISEIEAYDVITYLRLEGVDLDQRQMEAMMAVAQAYLSSYTGIPATALEGEETLDDFPTFWVAYMALCQDMYCNRTLVVDKATVNPVVESVLGMHTRNFV